MHYGLVFPTTDPHVVPDLSAEAEAAGWDGIFIPDSINIHPKFNNGVPMETHDPWIVLAAVALRTERLRFGTMLTAPARRRPWKLARELTTLDHLSNGRLILSGWARSTIRASETSASRPAAGPARSCWTRVWPSWMASGAANRSLTTASITSWRTSPSRQRRSRSRASRSG